jgi:ADP-ribose pyrophosphatase
VKFDFERLTFVGNGGEEMSRECIRHPGAVVIAPILKTPGGGRALVMIRNWRLSLERWMLELPAGTMTPGEDPRLCAFRELSEETGYAATEMELLRSFHTGPGLTDEYMHAFIANSLEQGETDLEDDERIQVEVVPFSSVPSLLDSPQLTDAKTLLVLHMLMRRGLFDAP